VPYLTQLVDVARRTGYPVSIVGGWQDRGHGPQPAVEGIVCHHTAGATAGGDYPSLAVVRDGRTGLPGPLSHFGLGRSGRIYVVAAGRCWHNAPSTSSNHTNSASIGIEAENDGRQPWPAAQLDAYKRLCAELCREFGLPASRVKAHREVNTGKPDPHSVDMTAFRADVARLIEGDDMPLSDADLKKIYDTVWRRDAMPAPVPSETNPTWQPQSVLVGVHQQGGQILAALASLPGVDVDEGVIVQGVLAGLAPEAIAGHVVAALPPDLAQQVVDAIAARLTNESPEG
jgi:hypothetical protein